MPNRSIKHIQAKLEGATTGEVFDIYDDKAVHTYDTVAQMVADTDLVDGEVCRTLGYYAANDGGGALYKIVSVAPTAHYETLANGRFAELIYEDIINVKQLGAHGDGVHDDTSVIQAAIDGFPFKRIFFEDGTYKVSSPIITSATPSEGVEMLLSRYAVIQADATDWTDGDYIINLGGKGSSYDANSNGATTGLHGGVIDCNGVANGVLNNGGRQFYIRDTDIKHVKGIGIGIIKGNSSADADIANVNIQGTNTAGSRGLSILANDNTFSHLRVNGFETGAYVESNGNVIDTVHVLFNGAYDNYGNTRGFYLKGYNNFFNNCYSDGYSIAYYLEDYYPSQFSNCFAYWYSANMNPQTAIYCPGNMRANFTNFVVGFYDGTTSNAVFLSETNSSNGKIIDLFMSNEANLTNANDKSKRIVMNKRYSSATLNDITLPDIYTSKEIYYERFGRVTTVNLKFTLSAAITSSENKTLVSGLPNATANRFFTVRANSGAQYRLRFGGSVINNAFVALPADTEIYGTFTYIADDVLTV